MIYAKSLTKAKISLFIIIFDNNSKKSQNRGKKWDKRFKKWKSGFPIGIGEALQFHF